MDLSPEVIWFLVGLALMLLEFAMPGVVLVFFGAAAWVVALTTYMGLTPSTASQLALFSVSTIALLVGLRKWLRNKLFEGHVTGSQNLNLDLDEYTGKHVLVIEDIVPGKAGGKVEFKGANWNATSETPASKGDTVTIKGIDGLTLIVEIISQQGGEK